MERTTPPIPTDLDRRTPATVERSVELDLDVAAALDAVVRPELLSAWLGPWSTSGDGATVVTDDGVTRVVSDVARSGDGVRWSWAPAGDGTTSEVTITVSPLDDGRSRVTVREVRAASGDAGAGAQDAGVALDGLGWAICLLALEIAAAARTLAVVGAA